MQTINLCDFYKAEYVCEKQVRSEKVIVKQAYPSLLKVRASTAYNNMINTFPATGLRFWHCILNVSKNSL